MFFPNSYVMSSYRIVCAFVWVWTIGLCCFLAVLTYTSWSYSVPAAVNSDFVQTQANQTQPDQIIFVDSTIPDIEIFLTHAAPNQRIVKLNPKDILASITETLTRYTNLKAIHLIFHGDVGQLQIGSDQISVTNLGRYRDQLTQWQNALTQQADILIYGCNVAAEPQGRTFLEQLHELTKADIQASIDLTGSQQYGGNWDLEVAIGSIETPLAFPPALLSTYNGILKQIRVTTLQDAGAGSLRSAITQANATPEADLIDLSQISGKMTLQSSLPKIASDLSIVGNGKQIISGNHANRVFYIDRGDVAMSHLTIADGLAKGQAGQNGAGGAAGMGGGLYLNEGTVTLSQMQFVNNHAIGGSGVAQARLVLPDDTIKPHIRSSESKFKVNRGAIGGLNGISLNSTARNSTKLNSTDPDNSVPADYQSDSISDSITVESLSNHFRVNRGAVAGVNGIGIGGVGSIAFGGGGGFGGFGNAGNGGNGGNAGTNGGNGGNGGDGGNGGVGIFGGFGIWDDQGGIGTIAFGGGGGFGGFGNAGNGGNGGNAAVEIATGGNGGNGGNGGFGGGGGAGGGGGQGGTGGIAGQPGRGGFAGGNGGVGYGGSGAGLGGAIFVRAGRLVLSHAVFKDNAAIGGVGIESGQGKGGAIFVMTAELGAQAEIAKPPIVVVLGSPLEFIDNFASDAQNTPTDNADVYGVIDQP